MKTRILYTLALVALLCSCGKAKFTVDGTVEGGGDTTKLVLEYSSNGSWFLVDSITTSNGDFSISEDAPEYPNIYRLRYNAQSIYLPIDSIDHITIKTKLKAFDTDYTLNGSDHAKQVMEVDKAALQFSDNKGTEAEMQAWKRKLSEQILQDPSGIVAYYIINKYINEAPLFDPLNDTDLKIIGAVANAFNTFKPNDPRTQYLVSVLLDGQKRRRQAVQTPGDTIYAQMTNLIDITLQDKNGVTQTLSKVASQGKVVLLNYTAYSAQFSPAFNKILNDIYTRYHSKGLEIYQIGLDETEVDWRMAAKNLPWITVYDPMGVQSPNVTSYNVTGIPTVFIIGHNGEVVERVTDMAVLADKVAKVM